MDIQILRRYYARGAKVYVAAYKYFVPIAKSGDERYPDLPEHLKSLFGEWAEEVRSGYEYGLTLSGHNLHYWAWVLDGENGSPPMKPTPPIEALGNRYIRDVVHSVGWVRDSMSKDQSVLTSTHPLSALARELLELKKQIEKSDDGPITRKQLAYLLDLEIQTLKNNMRGLPEPIKRDRRNAPIFLYSAAKEAASSLFPERAERLPSYAEAMRRCSQMST